MVKTETLTVTLAALLLGGWAWAGNEDTNPPPQTLRAELDLTDGSHIIGIPKIESVPVQTSYARMDIPLRQILSMKMDDDHETASLVLSNGDKLKGVVALKPLDLTTVFGPVKVNIEHLRTIIVSSGEGMPAILARSLVLHYSFDRDEGVVVTDQSPKKNNGSIRGAQFATKGKSGGGMQFDGANQP